MDATDRGGRVRESAENVWEIAAARWNGLRDPANA
jgi:hypothetical protein